MLVTSSFSPEHVVLHVLVGVGVALGDEGDRQPHVGPLQDQVLSRQASVPPLHSEVHAEVLSIAQHLIPQELLCRAENTASKVLKFNQRVSMRTNQRNHSVPGATRYRGW